LTEIRDLILIAGSSDAGVIGAGLNIDTSQGISNSLPLLCFEDYR